MQHPTFTHYLAAARYCRQAGIPHTRIRKERQSVFSIRDAA